MPAWLRRNWWRILAGAGSLAITGLGLIDIPEQLHKWSDFLNWLSTHIGANADVGIRVACVLVGASLFISVNWAWIASLIRRPALAPAAQSPLLLSPPVGPAKEIPLIESNLVIRELTNATATLSQVRTILISVQRLRAFLIGRAGEIDNKKITTVRECRGIIDSVGHTLVGVEAQLGDAIVGSAMIEGERVDPLKLANEIAGKIGAARALSKDAEEFWECRTKKKEKRESTEKMFRSVHQDVVSHCSKTTILQRWNFEAELEKLKTIPEEQIDDWIRDRKDWLIAEAKDYETQAAQSVVDGMRH